MAKRWVWLAVVALLAVQAAQVVYIVHRESLTFDEDDHMFAGYMMVKTGDYGLNPEHPPLVKLLAAVPLLVENLWTPPLQGRDFKIEAYLSGRDWLAHNDGASQRLVFRMRLFAGLLAVGLSLMVFVATEEWFGSGAGLIALLLLTFDPTVLGHSALVTTDIGVSLFFLASIFAFYCYVKRPTPGRLLLAGVAAGLLLATKHSGILLGPMLVLLIGWEIAFAPKGLRTRVATRLGSALVAIVVIGVVVLWAFYGFRYAARPAGLALSTSLAEYVKPLSPFNAAGVMMIAHLHLLPESYLMGLVDVKRMAQFYPTFIFGKVYAHGLWWYFPAVIVIKTTLGLLTLAALAVFAIVKGALLVGRELAFILLPCGFYLTVAIVAGMDIGARHILPVYVLAFIFAAGGLAALAARSQRWAWVGAVLILAHIVSSLTVFPNPIAYANEAWGGPENVHNLLSDANVDWAQQLFQVKAWQDQHPAEECWFAYFAYPEVDPAVYGIRCHALPTADTGWLGGSAMTPPVVEGTVLLSAGDLSGCEWSNDRMNPYRGFQTRKPAESIDSSVFVYRGRFDLRQAAVLSRAQHADALLGSGKATEALALAREAVALDTTDIAGLTALGNAAAALGQKDDARQAWQTALTMAQHMEQEAQAAYAPDLEAKLSKL